MATLYDGYLDNFIYYASFNKDQRSYFRFRNPFEGQNLTQGSISFWARLPKLSDKDSYYQTGRFFECQDQYTAKLDNNTIRVVLTQSSTNTNSQTSPNLIRTSLDTPLFINNTDTLLQWNHYAFSFKDKYARLHFNGIQANSISLNYSSLYNRSSFCTVGNSMDLQDPFNGYMRHLIFSKEGFTANQNITLKIRSAALPSDTNILAYFKFQKDFGFADTFFYNSSRNYSYSNIQISTQSYPEQVCYCSVSIPPILKITNDTILKALDLSPSTSTIDSSGFTWNFTLFGLKLESGSNDTYLFSISNYADIILTNNASNFRVDLYSQFSVVTKSLTFTKHTFRFQFWTTYTLFLNSTVAILYVDGEKVETQTHGASLGQQSSAKIQIHQPTTLTYLLYNMTLANSKKTTVYNKTFTRTLINNDFQLNYAANNVTLKWESNNMLCNATGKNSPSNYIDKSICKDNREYAYFSNSNSTTAMLTQLKSSYQTMTMEVWIKDMKSYTNSPQILFENSYDKQNILIQLMLNSTNNITNNLDKSIYIYTTKSYNPSANLTWSLGRPYNHWIHLSIISNTTGMSVLKYNQTTKTSSSYMSKGLQFINNLKNDAYDTAIGSGINGTNKFYGFIREFRFWTSSRGESAISNYRYNTLTAQSNLLFYFKMNTGLEMYSLTDYTNTYSFKENALNQTTISWTAEKDLIICPQGLYHNGQCCLAVNLTAVDFTFKYSQSKDKFQIDLTNTSTIDTALMSSIYADFTAISLGYSPDTTTSNKIKGYFTESYSQGFTVNASLVNPIVYSITIQAKIYSQYDSTTAYVTKTLTLQCPHMHLSLNGVEAYSDSSFIISNASDSYLKIDLELVQNNLKCYNPTKGAVETTAIRNITWSHNISSPSFYSLFTVNEDYYSITQNSGVKVTAKYNKINVDLYYGNFYKLESYVNLAYQNIQIYNNDFPSSQFIRNLLINKTLSIDLSNSYTSNTLYNTFTFDVLCPTELFNNNDAFYNSKCTINNAGQFSFNSNDKSLNIDINRLYVFYFIIGVKGTSIQRKIQGNITFYKNGTAGDCPRISYSTKYNYDKVLQTQYEIYPDPYLFCSGVFYEPQSIDWTVINMNKSTTLTGIFNQTTGIPLQLMIYNTNVRTIVGGTVLQVLGDVTLKPSSDTGYDTSINSKTLNPLFYVSFKNNTIQPMIVLQAANKTTITSRQVAFMEQNITLNASTSYDPDDPDAKIYFDWTCPGNIINSTMCKKMQTGTNNNSVVITLMHKFELSFGYKRNYTFNLSISTNNPDRGTKTTSIAFMFNLPGKEDLAYDMKSTNCESLEGVANTYLKKQTSFPTQYVDYTRRIWNQTFYNLQMILDNGQSNNPCGTGTVEQQFMYFYMFDGIWSTNTNPVLLYQANTTKGAITKTQTMKINFTNYPELQSIGTNQYFKTVVYLFTKRQGNTRIYLNQQVVYYQRVLSEIIPVLSQYSYTIDQYKNLILNASSSYDLEYPNNKAFTYIWSCPNNLLTCQRQNGSILNVTYAERTRNLINYASQQYQYSLYVKSGERQSNSTSASVGITQTNDYTYCISFQVTNDQMYVAYNYDLKNNTIYLEYNQNITMNIKMIIISNCDNINFYTPQIRGQQSTGLQFWKNNPTDKYSIQIGTQQFVNMTPGASNTLIFLQTISMGFDTDRRYNRSTYMNIYLNKPDLQPIVSGTLILFYGSDDRIKLDASKTYDPLGQRFSCVWDCPLIMGGASCSSKCLFEKTFSEIQASLGQGLEPYLENSYRFNVTITSVDGYRTAYSYQYVYLTDGPMDPLTQYGFSKCGIVLKGLSALDLYQSNVFRINCTGMDNLTTYIESNYNLVWSVQGLTPITDYYTVNNQLYLKPYVMDVLNEGRVIIKLNFTNSTGKTSVFNDDEIENALKKSFTFRRIGLTSGTVHLLNNNQTTYTSLISIGLQNFNISTNTTIYFQLRAYQNLYSASQLIIPLKPLTADVITNYYNNFIIPDVAKLQLDFYDLNLNFLGTYNLISNVLTDIRTGSTTTNSFNAEIFSITGKNVYDYINTDASKQVFENDIKRLLELTEMLRLNLVVGMNSVNYNTYGYKILYYLKVVLRTGLSYYNSQNTQEARTKQVIQKRVIMIYYNMMVLDSAIKDKVLQGIDSLDASVENFELQMFNGEDYDYLRKIVLWIQQQLNTVLVTKDYKDKTDYFTKALNITYNVYQADVNRSSSDDEKTSTLTTDSMCRIMYTISNVRTAFTLTNLLNINESVTFQDESLLYQMGITTLFVEFFSSTNTSSPVSSIVTINAFDSDYNVVDVNFTKSHPNYNNYYFTYNLQVKSNVSQIVTNSQKDSKAKSYYNFSCVYLVETQNKWSNLGVKVASFYSANNTLKCQTTHLSQFSAQYGIEYRGSTNDTPDGGNNGGQDPGHTRQNGTYVDTYYKLNTGDYVAAIVVSLIGLIVCILIIGVCFRKVDKYSDTIEVLPKRSYCSIFWAVLKVYHPLFSAFVNHNNKALALPKLFSQLALWIYVFSIVVSSLIDMLYVAKYNFTIPQILAYAGAYWAALVILRPIINKLIYSYYYDNEVIVKEQRKEEINYVTEQQVLKSSNRNRGNHSSSVKLKVESNADEENFEGGDKEGGTDDSGQEDIDESERDSDRSHSKSNPHSMKIDMEGRKSYKIDDNESISDVGGEQMLDAKHANNYLQRNSNTSDYRKYKLQMQMNKPMSAQNAKLQYQQNRLSPSDLKKNRNQNDFNGPQSLQQRNSQQSSASHQRIVERYIGPQGDIDGRSEADLEDIQISVVPEISNLKNSSPMKKSSPRKKSPETIIDKKYPKVKEEFKEEGDNKNDESQTYVIPKKQVRKYKKGKDLEGIELEEIIVIKNTNELNCQRSILLLLLVLLLIALLVITYVLMLEVKDKHYLQQWVWVILGMIAFFILFYDIVLAMIFTSVYQNYQHKIEDLGLTSAILVGNADQIALYQLVSELQKQS